MVGVELAVNGRHYGSVGGSPLTLVAVRWGGGPEAASPSAPRMTVCGIGDSGEEWPGPEVDLQPGDRVEIRLARSESGLAPAPEAGFEPPERPAKGPPRPVERIAFTVGTPEAAWYLAEVAPGGSLTALLTVESTSTRGDAAVGVVGLSPLSPRGHELLEWPARALALGERLTVTLGAEGVPTPPSRRVRDAVTYALGLQRQEFAARRPGASPTRARPRSDTR